MVGSAFAKLAMLIAVTIGSICFSYIPVIQSHNRLPSQIFEDANFTGRQSRELNHDISQEIYIRWLMGECIGVGHVRIGLPGITTLTLQLNPMLESLPVMRQAGDVGKMPMLPFSGMAVNSMIWLTYGILTDTPSVWLQNSSGVVFGLYYCKVFCRFCPSDADWLPLTKRYHWSCILATAVFCMCVAALPLKRSLQCLGVVGNITGLILFGSPLSAIRIVLKEQNTNSMAFGFTCSVALTCALWMYQGYKFLNDPFIYIGYAIGLALASIQLALFAYFDAAKVCFQTLSPKFSVGHQFWLAASPALPHLKARGIRLQC